MLGTVIGAGALTLGAGAAARPAAAQPEPDDDSLLGPQASPPPPAADAPDGDQPAEPAIDPEMAKVMAKKLIAGGDDFFKKGDQLAKRKKLKDAQEKYERALAAYQKAFELVPNPQIYFPIAQAEDKLERWVDAASHYRRFVTDAPEADAGLLTKATARLEAIKLNIGVITLAVQPEGAEVAIDGAVVGAAPLAEALFLAPGEHALTITAEGYQPSEQQLAIEAGSEAERTFELEPVPAVIVDTPPPPPPPVAPPPSIPGPSKVPLVLGGSVAVAQVGGATVTGVMALGRHETFVDDGASPTRRENARTEGKNLALITDGLIVGGVVAAGVTAYYYVKVYGPKRRAWEQKKRERAMGAASLDPFRPRVLGPAPGPKVVVTPWVEGSGRTTVTGLAFGGAL